MQPGTLSLNKELYFKANINSIYTLDIVHYLCPPRLAKYIPGAALMGGITVSKAKNSEKELELTVAIPTERTVDVIVKLPLVNISK